MEGSVIFDPLVHIAVLWVLVPCAALCLLLATWRKLSGWWLRTLAMAALILGIANPSLQTEDRDLLTLSLIHI